MNYKQTKITCYFKKKRNNKIINDDKKFKHYLTKYMYHNYGLKSKTIYFFMIK